MILKCPKCNGMMKIDEGLVPKTESFKVRCPHCEEIDTVPHPGSDAPTAEPAAGGTLPGRQSRLPLSRTSEPAPGDTADQAADGTEPSLPSDAFGRFRFPAEKEADEKPKKRMSGRTRILVWAGISVAVVVLLALLVNLVLPGPAKQGPDLGFVPPAAQSPNSSVPADKPGQPR